MHYTFIILILCLAGGGYYEYSLQNQEISKRDYVISKTNAAIAALNANITSLEANKADLTKKMQDATTSAIDLTTKLANQKSAANEAQKESDQAAKTATDASTAVDAAKAAQDQAKKDLDGVLHPVATDKLGTIATLNGKSYEDCVLKEVHTDGIVVVSKDTGYATILYAFLPGAIQRQFGYDPQNPLVLTPDEASAEQKICIENENK